ncbi:MAG: hypothetical protein IJT36_03140 [Alphaproteobacteria bacterium]|nr:hypothetical protein [Alphaproteobacteria bacterium]
MTDIIEELWHGNLAPQEFNHIENNPEYQSAIRLVSSNQERLTKDFTEQQKDLFERYNTSVDELTSQSELDAFKSGFKLATRLMITVIT